jgi:hypothetical protein
LGDLSLNITITDLPLETLYRIFNYVNTPSNYANINLVCLCFYNTNKMLKETKVLQFSKEIRLWTKETIDREGIYHGSLIYYRKLPNEKMLHGIHLTWFYTRQMYKNNFSYSNHVKCDIYEWGVLIMSYITNYITNRNNVIPIPQ